MCSLVNKVLVVGFGREGRSVVKFLEASGGYEVKVYDDNVEVMKALPIKYVADESFLNSLDKVIVSPGVRKNHPVLVGALENNVPVATGTNLFLEKNFNRVIGVTGSKGKSTTSSLIFFLMKSLGYKVSFGGNIGVSLLELDEADWYVAELSSYQNTYLQVSPRTAVITSLFPDHIDWHGSEQQYYTDKLNVIKYGVKNLVVNQEDETLVNVLESLNVSLPERVYTVESIEGVKYITRFGVKVLPVSDLQLLGEHNYVNVCLALEAVELTVGVPDMVELVKVLRMFKPLQHRIEVIGTTNTKHIFIDDTLATTPNATCASVKAVREAYAMSPIYLIVGGYDRGIVYDKVLGEVLLECGNIVVYCIPENGSRIAETIPSNVETVVVDSLEEAVASIQERVSGVVVLSPAASSYNLYKSYEEKSEAFRNSVNLITL